jgi:hypothetical protein
MEMDGGAMGGYWDMGRLYIARVPPAMMMMAMTHAKTGRFRKNLDSISYLRYSGCVFPSSVFPVC